MGKPYADELAQLEPTTREMFAFPVERLMRAIEDCAGSGLIIVASGGSHTVALYLLDLHQRATGHPCRIVTPLVFRNERGASLGDVWLLSAGGRNADILGAAEEAMQAGARSITALVATPDSPLERLIAPYGASRTVSFMLGAGHDGFLATNSLWGSCILLERAYQLVNGVDTPLTQADVEAALHWGEAQAQSVPLADAYAGLGDGSTLIGLSDLEMRATEAALASVWVTDLRNVGHGRHYWFAARGTSTQVICLATSTHATLVEQTAVLIQTAAPVHVIVVPGAGSHARLAGIAWSLHLAARLGHRLNRDPGRPGVPAFGEALYNLPPPPIVHHNDLSRDEQIILAKLGVADRKLAPAVRDAWQPHLDVFCDMLRTARPRAVVFDFDGTLIESARRYEPMEVRIVAELLRLLRAGVAVGIATGRGDSCGHALRQALPRELWDGVAIGYLNGAVCQALSDEAIGPVEPAEAIEEASRRIQHVVLASGRGQQRRYPRQCSVSVPDGRAMPELWTQVSDLLRDLTESKQLRVWMSSHSIDIVAGGVSKQNVVSYLASLSNCLPDDVLCIGDRGRWPGNDFELLDRPLSLSSEQCSSAPDRCWNLAGHQRRQVGATVTQLQMFDAVEGRLQFRETRG